MCFTHSQQLSDVATPSLTDTPDRGAKLTRRETVTEREPGRRRGGPPVAPLALHTAWAVGLQAPVRSVPLPWSGGAK